MRLTSLLAASVLFLGLAALAAAPTKNAQATDYYSGYRWQNSIVKWCFVTHMPDDWNLQYSRAAVLWSLPSNFLLPRQPDCSNVLAGAGRKSFTAAGLPRIAALTQTQLLDCLPYCDFNLVRSALTNLNTDLTWSTNLAQGASMGSNTNPCSPSCDIQTIILHEFGHWVVLDHGGCGASPKSIMCVDWRVRRCPNLNSHDKFSVWLIYGGTYNGTAYCY